MITLVFPPSVRIDVTALKAVGLAIQLLFASYNARAFPLGICLEKGDAPLCIVNTPAEACAIGQRLGEAVRQDALATQKYDAAQSEARRLAGASPAAEEMELVTGADGVPVAAKKTFRY